MATRRELVAAVGERYGVASRESKRRILDEFVAVTGYHRKHAIRVLRTGGKAAPLTVRPRKRIYDEAVKQAIVLLWEAADRLCSKRLKPLIPILVDAMERYGHLRLESEVRQRVLAISPASLDRLLEVERRHALGKGRRRSGVDSALRRQVSVRTFSDWHDPPPGYCETDLVVHCGGSVAGRFISSLVVTDIASGWTECMPLLVREQSLVVEAITEMRTQLPFVLRGLDTDNDSAFLNQTLLSYCREHGIEFTRSRPYRKNDQAWIEQKNGAVVRRLVGYDRLEGMAATEALSRLYGASRLYVNFFQPSFKLQSKTREGTRVIKRYHPPMTPCERLLQSDHVSADGKERLRARCACLDPIRLLKEIRMAQAALAELSSPGRSQLPEMEDNREALDGFLRSLSIAWQKGEVRPTHRKKRHAPRTWRTRLDPFVDAWPTLECWLTEVPDLSAKLLLDRLQNRWPGRYPDHLLRTLQRRVKSWRSAVARRLIFSIKREDDTTLISSAFTRQASRLSIGGCAE